MDLEPLLAIEVAIDSLIRRAVAYLAEGDFSSAEAMLCRGYKLRHDPLVALLLGFTARVDAGEPQSWEGASSDFTETVEEQDGFTGSP